MVAPDLRGFGASDKPPRGYDGPTLAADVAGLVRALGERRCLLVGQGWGGLVAWSVATRHPEVVRSLAVVAAAHPLRLRAALLTDRAQVAATAGQALSWQAPGVAERRLLADDAARVGALLHRWSGPGWPPPDVERRLRDAAQLPGVAHTSLEYHRWALRSLTRPSGLRWLRSLRAGVAAPVLQLHGALDSAVLPRTAQGSGRWVSGPYRWRLLDGVGHFPAQEAPDVVTDELRDWAREQTA